MQCYDVVIIGGGLAGLTLARQLSLELPQLRLFVIERQAHPVPEACHKVGESCVEIGTRYFTQQLQLEDHLKQHQLPKFGLRFFFPSDDNQDITSRYEMGHSTFPHTPSYQVDRGRFENYLAKLCQESDATFLDQSTVQRVLLAGVDLPNQANHQIHYTHRGQPCPPIEAKWVIDASGRLGLLKRKLSLQKSLDHQASAAWCRIKASFDIDNWSECPQWKNRMQYQPRRLSSNHFMGNGYWLWFVPLASGYTSIGLVIDERCHDFNRINQIDQFIAWLREYEPDCARRIESQLDKLEEFKFLRHYSHGCQQLFSANRWCITGVAGIFIDPFYSPGSDLIAISNDYVTALLRRSLENPTRLDSAAETFNQLYLQFFDIILNIYEGLYPKFGNAHIMTQKILWDSAVYLGITSLLYFNRKLTDLTFMKTIASSINDYRQLNYTVQSYFRDTPHNTPNSDYYKGFLDFSSTTYLGHKFSQALTTPYPDDDKLIRILQNNLATLNLLSNKITDHQSIAPTIQFIN